VDDEKTMRELETQMLIDHGYQVDAAEDGDAGWNALHAKRYDLLITDNNMPKVSGIELIKKVRSARMALPVIMATGALPEEVNLQPRLLDATLLKPFTSHELLEAVKRVLDATEVTVEQNEARPMGEQPQPLTGVARAR
jgi:DNA-binding response OmpR family regulator